MIASAAPAASFKRRTRKLCRKWRLRAGRVYGWEEKETKASWGGSTMYYKTIAGKAYAK